MSQSPLSINLPTNAPSGQTIDNSFWWRHEVQTLGGSNLGASVGTDWTDILLIDNRRMRKTFINFYNVDGAQAIDIRILGNLYNPSDDNPVTTDPSWITTAGVEICPSFQIFPTEHSDIIPTETPYTWILCQGKTATATALINAYYRGTN